jgi:membrane-bound lytic murein transglycosylase B
LIPDPEVLELAANQPEFVKTAGDYLTLLVSNTRLEAGRAKLIEADSVLRAVEAGFGVDRHIVVAIWGIESNYGAQPGSRLVIRSLATLAAYDTRRPQFWRAELIAALKILQAGDTNTETMAGSWAGAMGHTQFMPSTYAAHAVDFDKDGRRDIWSTVADALGSTANYLKASGWKTGHAWGFEVRLPAGFDVSVASPGRALPLSAWMFAGVTPVTAAKLGASDDTYQLILPAGVRGPAFLVGPNFNAILRYNNALTYALAVGHLADRLSGAAPFEMPWPVDDKALSRLERLEMQQRLISAGFDTGGVDGVLGPGTRSAVRAFQKARGLQPDGHADLALLSRLRQEGT